MAQSYPLFWPSGKPRTKIPARATFGELTFDRARMQLRREIGLLGAKDVILSTNLSLRNDGEPRSNQRVPDDRGIAVYFNHKGRPMCFACDQWQSMEHNVRAITKTIEAIRGIERWGGGSMVEQAFSGFTALPAPEPFRPTELWWAVIGVQAHTPTVEVIGAYREKAKLLHPDNGGDQMKMAALNKAYTEFKRERGL